MMIGMGTPISQSSAPLPNPMSMSSVWPATAPAHAQTFVGQKMFRPRNFRRRKPQTTSSGTEGPRRRYGIARDETRKRMDPWLSEPGLAMRGAIGLKPRRQLVGAPSSSVRYRFLTKCRELSSKARSRDR